MDASEQLQRTMDDMRPHGENLKGFSLRVLRVTNDLLATYQVYQFLLIDGGLLITGDSQDEHPYHVGH